MEKLIVNKEIGKSLSNWFNNHSNNEYSKESLLKNHYIAIVEDHRWTGIYESLNTLSLIEMSQIVSIGYEVELSKEELVLEMFEYNHDTACTTPKIADQWYANGFNDGIKYMNNIFELGLNIKISQ